MAVKQRRVGSMSMVGKCPPCSGILLHAAAVLASLCLLAAA